MIGGGIYALLGKVTSESGVYAPWSMLIAGLAALITALSFAELAARYPKSGGSAFYISTAFNSKLTGAFFGWLVIATGVVSAATLTVAASKFIFELAAIPEPVGQIFVVSILCLIACWGVTQSVVVVAFITLVEISGLIFVIVINSDSLANVATALPSAELGIWLGIFSGSILAFYAFIGFEDMVTLAEEVKDAKRVLPISIVVSILITLALYILVSLVAVNSQVFSSLGDSHSPMASLVSKKTYIPPTVMTLISLMAGFNGALVQVVMASRMLYGMAGEGQAPTVFYHVFSKTQTPVYSTLAAGSIVLGLTYLFDLTTLAKLTSIIILFVFTAVNAALLKVKLDNKKDKTQLSIFLMPVYFPLIGIIVSLLLFGFALWAVSK